jgi:hypothetical protein
LYCELVSPTRDHLLASQPEGGAPMEVPRRGAPALEVPGINALAEGPGSGEGPVGGFRRGVPLGGEGGILCPYCFPLSVERDK